MNRRGDEGAGSLTEPAPHRPHTNRASLVKLILDSSLLLGGSSATTFPATFGIDSEKIPHPRLIYVGRFFILLALMASISSAILSHYLLTRYKEYHENLGSNGPSGLAAGTAIASSLTAVLSLLTGSALLVCGM